MGAIQADNNAAAKPSPGITEVGFAQQIIRDEAEALKRLADHLPDEGAFLRAIDLLQHCAGAGGTVLVSGLGKSGIIGQKIAATLSSLGVASHFVHPAEAVHGDLGRFRSHDAVICISNSGETEEVVNLAAILRQDAVPVVAIVGGRVDSTPNAEPAFARPAKDQAKSSLERLASVTLKLHLHREAGEPEFVAPTSSTTATLALGDALALTLARRREFTDADFAKRHPGGALGGMLRGVIELLRFRVHGKDANLPLIPEHSTVAEALNIAASAGRRPGAMLLVDSSGKLAGIFTDGDLRRLVLRDKRELELPISRVMTRNPRSLPDTALIRDAALLFRECRQDEIPIVDADGRPAGLLDVQDLIAMKLVQA